MKTKKQNLITFDLVENAKDSLSHAVDHLTNDGKEPSAGDYKRAILDVAHTIELLLKERIRRIHPAFLWEKIENYKDASKRTIDVENAVLRLARLDSVVLSEESLKTIRSCRSIRNLIEHHTFEISSKEALGIIGRNLSFIFTFSKKHLELDLESVFKKDDRWSSLLEIYEFFEEHSKVIAEDLHKRARWILPCPQCGAETFDGELTHCEMCDHQEDLITCESCKEEIFESEAEAFEIDDEDVGGSSYVICRECLKDKANDANALDTMAEWYKE